MFYGEKNGQSLIPKPNFGIDKKPWFGTYRFFTFVFLFSSYLFLASSIYGEISSNKIHNEGLTSLRFADAEIIKGKTIGKTKEVIFLLQEDEKVVAVPITSLVKEITVNR